MYLSEIIDILKKDHNFREVITKQNAWYYHLPEKLAQIQIKQLVYDSRKASKDTLFFVKGQNFKESFLAQAIESGLRFYISQTLFYEVKGATAILVNDVKQAMALIAQAFFHHPEKKLEIIAFTGTKGKTTSVYFVKGILDEVTKQKTALFSTMETTLDGKNYFKSALTTPESLDLYEMMSRAVDYGMTHLVMEVSSQAYKMKRVYGLTFDVGVFLNISSDHIGPIEHPHFEDYLYCKRQILHNSKQVILNQNASYFALLLEESKESGVVAIHIYGTSNSGTDYFVKEIATNPLAFNICTGELSKNNNLAGQYTLRLAGDFNKENALAAIIASSLLGAGKSAAQKALAKVTVPGHMEVLVQKNGAHIYVDYAHNKISLEALLKFVKNHHQGTLIVVLGSPGNKGLSRRQDFGEMLSQFADIAVLTTDDPDFEDPVKIAREIACNITSQRVKVEILSDRTQAISHALSLTKSANDAVVLAGKGADCYQIVQGAKVPYKGDLAITQKFLIENLNYYTPI
ncbi:MAG: UDP-N-acetylmuramoyl-L-alanyl-D-glutamate--L-lysine ligase [Lactobacillales bacterium]|jgi:UDP-N-acetylmuramoyl-L-alanyl-D-glutamate-L-lysine ligase|nr:UDP-N-acetylmuramoyl-L-alanyl-D-glutamate--L-lysine ligase [Lactobacillales bacterium]